MISKIDLRMCGGELTKDDRDYEGLDVLCAGFVGVSREIGNVQSQGGVVTQDSIEIGEKGPSEGRAAYKRWLSDNWTVGDGAAGSAQGITKNGQEDDGCNDTLESEEVLNLGVRDAEEGKLEQEVEHKATHSSGSDTFTFGNVIGDVSKAWPDSCEQDCHALTASCGLNTAYN